MLNLLARTDTGRFIAGVLGLLLIGAFVPWPPAIQLSMVTAFSLALPVVGIDLAGAYGGQFLFGQMGFVAIGAYGTAYLDRHYHIPFGIAAACSIFIAAVIATALGVAVTRLSHFGAALATFFFGFVVSTSLTAGWLGAITNGESGVPAPQPVLFHIQLAAGRPLYLFAWGLMAIGTTLAYRYVRSRSGRALMLSKSNAVVASLMGVQVRRSFITVMVNASILAAAGGVIYLLASGYLAPESFSLQQATTLVAMAAVGGLGTLGGPLLGAIFFTVIPQVFNASGSTETIAFAAALLAVLVAAPRGIYGIIESSLGAIGSRRRRRAVTTSPGTEQAGTVGLPAAPPVTRSEPGATVLLLEGVSVRYGGVQAVRNLDLKVREGEIHGIVGPNGAGKTSLLNAICGNERTEAGRIALDGERIDGASPARIRQLGIVRAFQHPTLAPDLTALENVTLGLYAEQTGGVLRDVAGIQTHERDATAEARATEALAVAGARPERSDVLAADLAGAEAKLVDVARALAGHPRLLVLDEPTAGLTESDVGRLAHSLRQANATTGITVLVIAHHIAFIREIADVVTVMNFGEVLAEGPPGDLFDDASVREVFVGS